MKIIDTAILLFLGLASYVSALDQPKSHIRHSETSDNRELFFFGKRACQRSLNICQAITGVAQLPYAQWIETLDMIDGQNDLIEDTKNVIALLSTSDFSGLAEGITAESEEIASAVAELQSAVAMAQLEDVGSEVEDAEIKFGWIRNLVTTVVSVVSNLTPGVNFGFLNPMLDLVEQTLSLLNAGPAALSNVIIKALGDFAINMAQQFVQGILGGGNNPPNNINPNPNDIPDGTSAIEEAPTVQSCRAELMECEFNKMVLAVLPALVGGALIIAGTAISGIQTP